VKELKNPQQKFLCEIAVAAKEFIDASPRDFSYRQKRAALVELVDKMRVDQALCEFLFSDEYPN